MSETDPIPTPVRTVENILDTLNTGLNPVQWVWVESMFAMGSPVIENKKFQFANIVGGVGMLIFINTITQEVKLYAAKYTDVPGREKLF
ncbi:MAG: hypothetical protein JWL80_69 [Parcubacteria group bacterium]|nr:hypothetical protein [Parcubacteria group bacterium]